MEKKYRNIKFFREFVETNYEIESESESDIDIDIDIDQEYNSTQNRDSFIDRPNHKYLLGREIPRVNDPNVTTKTEKGRLVYSINNWKNY